jgi:hypothetical protein
MYYTGTTAHTHNDRSYMSIYRIINWKAANYKWRPHYKRIHIHRYCTGYKKTATNHRSVTNCANWVKSVDPEARYFFFREQSNWHCSPCPLYYKGNTTYTAVDRNTRIHIYRIIAWKAPTFKW